MFRIGWRSSSSTKWDFHDTHYKSSKIILYYKTYYIKHDNATVIIQLDNCLLIHSLLLWWYEAETEVLGLQIFKPLAEIMRLAFSKCKINVS